MIYDYGGYDVPDETSRKSGRWSSLHPGVRSAIFFWAILLVISLFNTVSGGASLVLCYPVQVLLYAANGALAAHFAVGSGYYARDLPKVGAIAGLVAWLLPAVYYLVFGIILGIVSLGIGFLVGATGWLLCGPIDLGLHAAMAAFGAWLYGRFSGAPTETPEPYQS